MLRALGYDPYSSDIVPEYAADIGIKKGEKVDYLLQVDGKPCIIVECKKLSEKLSEKHISQLFRYFTVCDVRVAILTNGNDYWFFTDSVKKNVMDLEPYDVLSVSEKYGTGMLSNEYIVTRKLKFYTKALIRKVNPAIAIKEMTKAYEQEYIRVMGECINLVENLREGDVPYWLAVAFAKEKNVNYDADFSLEVRKYFRLAFEMVAGDGREVLHLDNKTLRTDGGNADEQQELANNAGKEVDSADSILVKENDKLTEEEKKMLIKEPTEEIKTVDSYIAESQPTEKPSSLGEKMKATRDKNLAQLSNIKLNHEYIYNDYSDGDWKFHKLDYAIILNVRYDGISGRELLVGVFAALLQWGYIESDKIVNERQFWGAYKIGKGKGDNVRAPYYFKKYDIYISTSYGILAIVGFIEKLLRYAGLEDSCVKLSFKE